MIPSRKNAEHVTPPRSAEDRWDQEIDAVLGTLGLAEPAPGMTERLQLRVPALATPLEAAGKGDRTVWFGGLGAATALAGACLLLVLLSHSAGRSRPAASPGSSAAERASTAATMQPAAAAASPRSASEPMLPVFHLAVTNLPRNRQRSVQVMVPAAVPGTQTEAQLDAQALADTMAPSSPSPTLELTAGERQLNLLLRGGERRQLAELSPLRMELRQQQDRAELHHFFDPPPPPYPLPLPYIEQLDGARRLTGDGKTTNAADTR